MSPLDHSRHQQHLRYTGTRWVAPQGQAEPGPVPAVAPLPAIWNERACWVQRIDGAPAIELGAVMRAHGYTVAILYVYDPDGWTNTERAWSDAMRAQGLKVMGSHWGDAVQPSREAERAWETCWWANLDGWIVNGEKLYEGAGKSAQFVQAFRRWAHPDFPLGWSPEPQLALDHDVFRKHQVCYMPQAYLGENGYGVRSCVDVALRFGYEPSQVKPLVGVHAAAVGGLDPVGHLADEARGAHVAGCLSPVLYPAEQAVFRPELWKALAGGSA